MCWVAFDRVSRLVGEAFAGRTNGTMAERFATRFTRTSSRTSGAKAARPLVQYKGPNTLDASVLLMPLMRFISPVDPRWLSTLEAIEKNLTEDALVYRYDNISAPIDGLPVLRAVLLPVRFGSSSAWRARIKRKGRSCCSTRCSDMRITWGLYSEQLGSSGEHLGNFPQAFTHLALISAATFLDRALSGTGGATWR